jgi:hypothetical protein
MSRGTQERVLSALVARLSNRRPELVRATFDRASGIADPAEVSDHAYVHGLREAVAAGIDYGLSTIEVDKAQSFPPVPVPLLAQARLAARSRVSLDTVLRRYCAGNSVFSDALLEEAEHVALPRAEVKRLLRSLALSFDHLLAAVSDEYARDEVPHPEGTDQRRAALVARLLAGELLEPHELGYGLDLWHLGIVASGPGAGAAIHAFAATFNRTVLLASRDFEAEWAWLGGREPLRKPDVWERIDAYPWPAETFVGVGEPAHGFPGWRLTHRQAAVAFPVAVRSKQRVVHYSQVPLLAAALQDDLLATSLRQLYLEPLSRQRDGGAAAKETLRAYFSAAGNVSSAAAALGISRRTLSSRIVAIEERLGRTLQSSSAEIETALGLDRLEAREH